MVSLAPDCLTSRYALLPSVPTRGQVAHHGTDVLRHSDQSRSRDSARSHPLQYWNHRLPPLVQGEADSLSGARRGPAALGPAGRANAAPASHIDFRGRAEAPIDAPSPGWAAAVDAQDIGNAWLCFEPAHNSGPLWASPNRPMSVPALDSTKPDPWIRAQKSPRKRGLGCGGYGWTRTTDPSIMSAVL